jgi:hypothetical protein
MKLLSAKPICLFVAVFMLAGLQCMGQELMIRVSNNLDFVRNEVVAISYSDLLPMLKSHNGRNSIRIKKKGTANYMVTQWMDYDGDDTPEELLFQADVPANSVSVYNLLIDAAAAVPKSDIAAFSRFVPERTDDYTWENDKVAFRTYGPKGQQEALAGVPGSTMSSGIDIWFKKVSYPIIDKWYAGYVQSPGYYHKDHGEGYDPYHVGGSRGTGGLGVWVNDSLQVSKNYSAYKTIATGPLRTVFELIYAPWSDYGIHEAKRISLDLGTNFSKFEISLSADKKVPDYAIGITLHENKGEAMINKDIGWFRHWEAIDDSFVGEGIVIDPSVVQTAFARVSKTADQSNILILTNPVGKLTYYAGFAWQKSGQVASKEDWDAMLGKQVQIIKNPLKVIVSNRL